MKPIKNQKRDWVLMIEGKETVVGSISLVNRHIGIGISYGWRPEGYDGVYIQRNRGGAVILPYIRSEVGLLKEWRSAEGKYIYNAPRGSRDENESVSNTAIRELEEEAGLKAETLVHLASDVNNDNAFFKGSGVDLYAVEMTETEVGKTDFGVGEDIKGLEFFNVLDVLSGKVTNDMFTIAAAGMLYPRLK